MVREALADLFLDWALMLTVREEDRQQLGQFLAVYSNDRECRKIERKLRDWERERG